MLAELSTTKLNTENLTFLAQQSVLERQEMVTVNSLVGWWM